MDKRKCHYIKLGRKWFSIEDLFESINMEGINPETKKPFTGGEKKHISARYHSMVNQFRNENDNEIDNEDTRRDTNKTIENKLDDYIEIYDSQINELQNKQEELYSLIHTMQHTIDKLNVTRN